MSQEDIKRDIHKIQETLSKIESNHLTHLELYTKNTDEKISDVKKTIEKIDGRMWVLLLGVVSIFVTVAVERLF